MRFNLCMLWPVAAAFVIALAYFIYVQFVR